MKDKRDYDSQNKALNQLIDSEFVFVTGKGGVGKSTVSALIGLTAAERGKRTLIVYPEGSPSAEELWNQSLNDVPKQAARNLDIVAVEPEAAMRQYVAEVLGSTKLASLLFHQRIAQGLLTGIPGPSDWALLGRAWSYTKGGVRDGNRKEKPYDLVVMDAPASGDGSGMLRIPQVILDLAPAARLRRDAESCLRLLQDERRAQIVFVTLVEHLPITETEENLELVRNGLSMPVGPVFVNQVLSREFSSEDREILLKRPPLELDAEVLRGGPSQDSGTSLTDAERAAICESASIAQATREAAQERYMRRIHEWQVPLIELPRLSEEETGLKALRSLQMALAAGH